MLYIFGTAGSIFIYYLSTQWKDIFQLQFVMFGAGLSLAPWLIYGCLIKKSSQPQSKQIGFFAFLSISFGLLSTLIMYFIGYYTENPDISGYIPLVVLLISTLFSIISWVMDNSFQDKESLTP